MPRDTISVAHLAIFFFSRPCGLEKPRVEILALYLVVLLQAACTLCWGRSVPPGPWLPLPGSRKLLQEVCSCCCCSHPRSTALVHLPYPPQPQLGVRGESPYTRKPFLSLTSILIFLKVLYFYTGLCIQLFILPSIILSFTVIKVFS